MRISDWSSDVCSSDLSPRSCLQSESWRRLSIGREVEKRRVRDYVGAMNAPVSPASTPSQRQRKPDWIRVKAPTSPGYAETRKLMRELNLHTVCEEAACPNIGECWTKKHATVMILGDTCRSEEHTSELPSLMRISYAGFCLKQNN